ncbi:MAG: DUF2752 domain-containing protein [Flavobacteriales bacterium]|nr:MAG: DUF2752 domain-containing protein [Flavobacteriales bacterium]
MRGWGTGLAALGGAVLLAYLYAFDPGKGGYPSCPFRFFTGWDCPGCGSQRSVHELLHGHFQTAWGHNAFLLLALPLAGLHWALLHWFGEQVPTQVRRLLWWGWVAAIAGWGVLRNFN